MWYNNKTVCLNKTDSNKNANGYPSNFKTEWTINEIQRYVLDWKQMIEDIKPDGLIFIITSHGNTCMTVNNKFARLMLFCANIGT